MITEEQLRKLEKAVVGPPGLIIVIVDLIAEIRALRAAWKTYHAEELTIADGLARDAARKLLNGDDK